MLGTHFDHVYEYNTVCYCVGQCTLESHIIKMRVAFLIFTSRFHKKMGSFGQKLVEIKQIRFYLLQILLSMRYQNYISGGECKRVLCASLFNST